jgi:hypothetical protein
MGSILSELCPAILSAIGCLIMLVSYITFQKLKTMWFAIAGIGNSLVVVFGFPESRTASCYMQCILGTYFPLLSMMASALITWTIYLMFYPPKNQGAVKWVIISKTRIMVVWGTPLVFTILPFFSNSYGSDGGHRYGLIDRFYAEVISNLIGIAGLRLMTGNTKLASSWFL